MNEGKVAAMKALKKALDAGDFEGAAEAFQSAYDLCADYEPEEKEPPSKKPGGLAILIGKAKPKGGE